MIKLSSSAPTRAALKALKAKGIKVVRSIDKIPTNINPMGHLTKKIVNTPQWQANPAAYLQANKTIYVTRDTSKMVNATGSKAKPTNMFLHEYGHTQKDGMSLLHPFGRERAANKNALDLIKKTEKPEELYKSYKSYAKEITPAYDTYRTIADTIHSNIKDKKLLTPITKKLEKSLSKNYRGKTKLKL